MNLSSALPDGTYGSGHNLFDIILTQFLAYLLNIVVVVGGSYAMRKYWSSFIQDTCILIFVVDSADEKRLPESFSELHKILGDERLSRVPIVILANKQVKFVLTLCTAALLCAPCNSYKNVSK